MTPESGKGFVAWLPSRAGKGAIATSGRKIVVGTREEIAAAFEGTRAEVIPFETIEVHDFIGPEFKIEDGKLTRS